MIRSVSGWVCDKRGVRGPSRTNKHTHTHTLSLLSASALTSGPLPSAWSKPSTSMRVTALLVPPPV